MNTHIKIFQKLFIGIVLLLSTNSLVAQIKKKDTIKKTDTIKKADTIKKDSAAYSVKLKKVNVYGKVNRKKKEIGKKVITIKDISRQMMQETKDYIRYVPGVGISESGSRFGSKGYAIRGVEENRVAISVDGMPQAETEVNVVFSSYGLVNSARPEFESEFVKKIEIKKGAASFEHGTGALGGAVNFETKDPKTIMRDGKNYGVAMKGGFDTKTNARIYSFGVAGKYKNFEAIAMYANRVGNELNNFGKGDLRRSIFATRLDPIHYNQQSLLGKVSYENLQHKFTVSYYAQNKRTNTDVWSMEPTYVLTSKDEPYYYGHDQVLTNRWDFAYKFKPKESEYIREVSTFFNTQNSYLDADTQSSIYKPYITDYKPNYIFGGKRRFLKGMHFNDKVFAVKAISKLLDLGKYGYQMLTFNASYLMQNTSNKNVDITYPVNTNKDGARYKGKFYPFGASLPQDVYVYSFQRPAFRNNFSVSLSDKMSISNKLKVDLGLRFDYFESGTNEWKEDNDFNYLNYLIGNLRTAGMNFDKVTKKEMGFTPMAVVSYMFNPYFNLGYKFSTGYRVPTSQERFFQYVSLSPAFFVISNADLKRESSYNNEIKIGSKDSKYFSYDASVYYNSYKDYIEPIFGVQKVFLDGQNRDVAYSINVNKKSAKLWGGDISTEIYLDEIFPQIASTGSYKIIGSANYSEGSFSDGTSMMSVQPLKAIVGFDYDLPKEKAGISFRMNLLKAKDIEQTKFLESFYGDEKLSQFPYNFFQNNMTLDLFGYVNIGKNVTLRASVFNLTNQKYLLWDDVRQLISPIMLTHHKQFFKTGPKSIQRFTQPRRYFSVSLEINI